LRDSSALLVYWRDRPEGSPRRPRAPAAHPRLPRFGGGDPIEDYAETLHGHQVLHLIGWGTKPATVPPTVPVLRDLEACHERAPVMLPPVSGKPIDRRDVCQIVRRIARSPKCPATGARRPPTRSLFSVAGLCDEQAHDLLDEDSFCDVGKPGSALPN